MTGAEVSESIIVGANGPTSTREKSRIRSPSSVGAIRTNLHQRSVHVPTSGREGSQPLEAAKALPIGDGGVEGLKLDVGHVRVVLDDVRAERGVRQLAVDEQCSRLA